MSSYTHDYDEGAGPDPDDYYGQTIHGQEMEEWDAARTESDPDDYAGQLTAMVTRVGGVFTSKKKRKGEQGGRTFNFMTRTTQVVDNSRSYSITGPRRSW